MQVEEDRAAPHVILNLRPCVLAHGLKQRMAGRDPLQSGILLQELLVENTTWIFPSELAEARLQAFSDWPEIARHPADFVVAPIRDGRVSGACRMSGAAWRKKSSMTSGTSRRSLASADLPMMAERLSSRLARPSRVGIR